jgi:hypothetical protein
MTRATLAHCWEVTDMSTQPRLNAFGRALVEIEERYTDVNAALWAAESEASLSKMIAAGGQAADGARDELQRRQEVAND